MERMGVSSSVINREDDDSTGGIDDGSLIDTSEGMDVYD
jgi:hypothetical protein